MVVKITNTKINALTLCYRMPKAPEQERANPVLEINLPARALLQEVSFPSEEYFNAFKSQVSDYIERGDIIIGKSNEKEAIKKNESNAKIDKGEVSEKIDKNTKQLENSAGSVKAKMKMQIKKDSE